MRKPLVRSDKTFLIVGVFGVIFLAYFAFAVPSVTFQSPTLSDNATTGVNWVYINATSTEDLNQSLLEWGNSTGLMGVGII